MLNVVKNPGMQNERPWERGEEARALVSCQNVSSKPGEVAALGLITKLTPRFQKRECV